MSLSLKGLRWETWLQNKTDPLLIAFFINLVFEDPNSLLLNRGKGRNLWNNLVMNLDRGTAIDS